MRRTSSPRTPPSPTASRARAHFFSSFTAAARQPAHLHPDRRVRRHRHGQHGGLLVDRCGQRRRRDLRQPLLVHRSGDHDRGHPQRHRRAGQRHRVHRLHRERQHRAHHRHRGGEHHASRFPAVPAARRDPEDSPPWVGAPLPATGLAAAPSAGSSSGSDPELARGRLPHLGGRAHPRRGGRRRSSWPSGWRHRRVVAAPSPRAQAVRAGRCRAGRPRDRRRHARQVPPVAPLTPVIAISRLPVQDSGPRRPPPPPSHRPRPPTPGPRSPTRRQLHGPDRGLGVDRSTASSKSCSTSWCYHDGHHMSAEQILLAMRPTQGPRATSAARPCTPTSPRCASASGPSTCPTPRWPGATGSPASARTGPPSAVWTDEADTVGRRAGHELRTEALALVRGRPFEGASGDLYEWVDEEHLAPTSPSPWPPAPSAWAPTTSAPRKLEAAEAAARSGLVGASDDYGLWDLGARAIDARADRDRTQALDDRRRPAPRRAPTSPVSPSGLEHHRSPET